MKRKLVSLLLAALLLCSLLPQISLPARARDAYSGSCGDGLKWRFEAGSGTLTITGNDAPEVIFARAESLVQDISQSMAEFKSKFLK